MLHIIITWPIYGSQQQCSGVLETLLPVAFCKKTRIFSYDILIMFSPEIPAVIMRGIEGIPFYLDIRSVRCTCKRIKYSM